MCIIYGPLFFCVIQHQCKRKHDGSRQNNTYIHTYIHIHAHNPRGEFILNRSSGKTSREIEIVKLKTNKI